MQTKKPAIASDGAKDENIASIMSKQTTYLLPIITIFFGIQFPAGVTLYWIVSTLFQIGQQWYFMKRHAVPSVTEELTKV